jgi:phasin family protein
MAIEETKTTEKARPVRTAKPVGIEVVEKAQDQLTRAAETHFKAADDVAAYGKSNIEAVIQAGSSLFKGIEELTRGIVGLTQTQLETSIGAAKALLGAKTLAEFTDAQNAYTKTAFDLTVSEATRLSELAIRVTNEAIEPLNARMTATIEQFTKPALAA